MIKENASLLTSITDDEWGRYAFSRDPLNRKISEDFKKVLIEKANKCGQDEAIKLKGMYSDLSIKNITKKMNLDIIIKDSEGADNYIMFACYNSPNKITIFNSNVTKVKKLIDEEELEDVLGYVDVKNMLIAHELFHHIEEKDKDIFTRREKITLWNIGKYEYKSHMVALGEIAAMAFAKEMLSLNYNPYVFDVIMLYPHNKEKADELYKEIIDFKGGV